MDCLGDNRGLGIKQTQIIKGGLQEILAPDENPRSTFASLWLRFLGGLDRLGDNRGPGSKQTSCVESQSQIILDSL